jgi:hypothetical protein
MYTHACICASLSDFSSGNETEVDNLAGRSASSSNVPLHMSVQQKKRETECRKNSTGRESERERGKERRNITINFPFLND